MTRKVAQNWSSLPTHLFIASECRSLYAHFYRVFLSITPDIALSGRHMHDTAVYSATALWEGSSRPIHKGRKVPSSARVTTCLALWVSISILQIRLCSSKYFTKHFLSKEAKSPHRLHR